MFRIFRFSSVGSCEVLSTMVGYSKIVPRGPRSIKVGSFKVIPTTVRSTMVGSRKVMPTMVGFSNVPETLDHAKLDLSRLCTAFPNLFS